MPTTATGLFPVLTTADLDGLLRFYRDLLGGTVGYRFPDDGPVQFVSLDLGSGHLGIGVVENAVTGPQRTSLWVNLDRCDDAVAAVRGVGLEVVEEPVDQPWGERVALVRDPDGNAVYLSSPAG